MDDATNVNEFSAIRARTISPVVETLGRMLTSQGREFRIDDSHADRTSVAVTGLPAATQDALRPTVTFVASGHMIGIYDQNTGPALDSPYTLISECPAADFDQNMVSAALTKFMADITPA